MTSSERPRLPKLAPGSLDDAQRTVYEAIAGGRRAQGPQLFRLTDDDGCLEGPFNGFLLQPRVGGALQGVGSALRYETSLSDRAREIAIPVVAAHWDSAFEWYAHEAVGRNVGLTDDELAAIATQHWDAFERDERVVATTTYQLASASDLDDATYDEVVALLGRPALFELLTIVGYYATLALQLRVFRVAAPDN